MFSFFWLPKKKKTTNYTPQKHHPPPPKLQLDKERAGSQAPKGWGKKPPKTSHLTQSPTVTAQTQQQEQQQQQQ
jgi:hypothetical protein